jgi:hypothetical protein
LADELCATYPDLRVVLMSGYAGEALGALGISDNMLMVEKPFTPSQLVRAVRTAVDGSAGLSAADRSEPPADAEPAKP